MRDYLRKDSKIRFEFPIDGDCVNIYDGEMKDGVLFVRVKVCAKAGSKIEINQIPTEFDGEFYVADIPIYGYKTNLVARDDLGNEEIIVIYKLEKSTGIYRLSAEDNILFLQDITKNKDKYKSIFENPYLAMYKRMHDKYDANVQLNVHWEFTPNEFFSSPEKDYFNLSMMTDKFKEEFRQNSNWLRLSFHAEPSPEIDTPYLSTDMKTIEEGAKKIYKEVLRFAGEETLCVHNTAIHWGECTADGMRAMGNLGLRGLYGYFNLDEKGEPIVSYFFPSDLVSHIHNRDFWYDNELGILFGRIDLVLNCYKADEIVPLLEDIKKNPNSSGCIDIMIHEQYFHKDSVYYLPDFEELVENACKWCFENGYKGYYMTEIVEKI